MFKEQQLVARKEKKLPFFQGKQYKWGSGI
jgi:hypothetical protein